MSSSPDIQYIKGVGPSKARLFNKLGIFSVGDLVSFYPRGYMDLSAPTPIDEAPLFTKACIKACIVNPAKLIKRYKGMEIYKAGAADDSGEITLIFFNQKYSALNLQTGRDYFFYGAVGGNLIKKELVNPYIEPCEGRCGAGLVPVYPTTSGLSQKLIRKTVLQALNEYDCQNTEVLREDVRMKYSLSQREYALHNIHNPKDGAALEMARKRLVFEEMLIFNGALQQLKKESKKRSGHVIKTTDIKPYLNTLGFEMTDAQKRAVNDCVRDMKSGYCMDRLIQGDVGCGKTAVACAALYLAVINGGQAAFMAPTEVLANQHFADLTETFEKLNIKVGLLTGSMTASRKRAELEKAKSGQTQIIIGTHALISEGVEFNNLTLIVTDEQHRFGVGQRKALQNKGKDPHMLIMSATPIPRTLAMVLYAELDISVIDTLPPGRKPVKTYAVGKDKRERLYNFVKKNILEGRQAYIICAKAEDDEKSDLVSVKELTEELQNGYLKDIKIAYIHGKMAQKSKDAIMTAFAKGEIQALVSTTVVEVGVNVPNATVMVIENAERFGLSSLHQLRGRVGRGSEQAYCILLSDTEGENALSRLDIMTKTNDGFEISRRDLEIRGPGEFFGTRQSGLVRFQIANLMTDMAVISRSKECLDDIIKDDPTLSKTENKPLKDAIEAVLEKYTT